MQTSSWHLSIPTSSLYPSKWTFQNSISAMQSFILSVIPSVMALSGHNTNILSDLFLFTHKGSITFGPSVGCGFPPESIRQRLCLALALARQQHLHEWRQEVVPRTFWIDESPPETYVIPNDPIFSKIPGFELQEKITHILANSAHDPGDSVIILNYSGHGRENLLRRLELCSVSGRVIAVDHLLQDVLSECVIPFDEQVDVVVILDSCFVFLASQTLSASEERNSTALGAKGTNSFTSKLLVEAWSRAQNGDQTIKMSNLINKHWDTSPVKKPTYARKLGPGSEIVEWFWRIPLDYKKGHDRLVRS